MFFHTCRELPTGLALHSAVLVLVEGPSHSLAASVACLTSAATLLVCIPKWLTKLDTGMGVSDQSGKKDILRGNSSPNGKEFACSKIDR